MFSFFSKERKKGAFTAPFSRCFYCFGFSWFTARVIIMTTSVSSAISWSMVMAVRLPALRMALPDGSLLP